MAYQSVKKIAKNSVIYAKSQRHLSLYPGGVAAPPSKLGGGNFRPFCEVGGKSKKSIGNWIVILGLVDRGGQ